MDERTTKKRRGAAAQRPPSLQNLSSLPPDYRPGRADDPPEIADVDRWILALREEPDLAAVQWFDDEWSYTAIRRRDNRKRREQLEFWRARHEKGADPSASLLPTSDRRRKVPAVLRLLPCVRALIDVAIPTGAVRADRAEHARRIVYVHRLLRDPDLPYGNEPYGGANSREWALGSLEGEARTQWYELVAWAREELQDVVAPDRSAGTILSEDAREALVLFLEQAPSAGLAAKVIAKEIRCSEDRVRKGIRDQLLPLGLENQGKGYFIPTTRRAAARKALGMEPP